MAGKLPRASKKINEHEDGLGGFVRSLPAEASSKQSTFVSSHFGESSIAQQLITTSTSSFGNVPVTRSREHLRSDYQPIHGSTPVSSISPCLVASHSSSFSNSDDLNCKKEAEPEQTKTRARGFSCLPDMDVGFDSGFLSFTQCLQEGMSMNAADYTDLTKSVSANILQTYLSPYQGFRQQEKSSLLFHSFETHKGPFSLPDFEQQEDPSTSERLLLNVYERASLTGEAGTGGPSREASTVPGTPNSSMSSSSSDGQDQEPSRAEIVAGGSGDSQVIPKKSPEEVSPNSCAETAKKPSRPRKKGQKRIREPRIALVTKSDVEHLEDGFRWRKYGQKAVKNSPYPRSYYRCTNNKCSVKKRVERSSEDPSMVITTYEGQHTHHSPGVLRGSTEVQFRNPQLTPFCQSPFTFPGLHLQMQPPRSNFDPATQLQDQEITARSPQYRGQDTQPPRQPPPPQNDEGLLEDMLPPGVRKLA